jgi:hypothetical protein
LNDGTTQVFLGSQSFLRGIRRPSSALRGIAWATLNKVAPMARIERASMAVAVSSSGAERSQELSDLSRFFCLLHSYPGPLLQCQEMWRRQQRRYGCFGAAATAEGRRSGGSDRNTRLTRCTKIR